MHTEKHTDYSKVAGENLAPFLGWFSLGLGLAELAAPRAVARGAGMRESKPLMRLFGLREILSGAAVLSRSTTPIGLWSRVAGDVMDLSVLGKNYVKNPSDKKRLAAAAAAVLGVTALDIYSSVKVSKGNGYSSTKGIAAQEPNRLKETIAIMQPPYELYKYWRNLNNLPEVMSFVDSAEEKSPKLSHWKLKPIAGQTIEWDAEFLDDKPGEIIAWRTVEGSDISHSGSVSFKKLPGNKGTLVTLEMRFSALPTVGGVVQKFMKGIGEMKMRHDLKRFKALMETGEIPTTRGQPHGRSKNETLLDGLARV